METLNLKFVEPRSRKTQPPWDRPFDLLRKKWQEVPAGETRLLTSELVELPDKELKKLWERERLAATTGAAFEVRGWYHTLYREVLRSKRVMDFGCGFGMDGITFAQHGAQVNFVDIVESNLIVVKRLCRMFHLINVDFFYLEEMDSFSSLRADFDVVWCQGSLINAPFDVIREEVQELLKRLPVGGRWIELAYPKRRWEREGRLPFHRWGERTDGPGTPWVEWYDLPKLKAALEPAQFDVILYFEFHHGDFNWFDLVRRT